MGLVEFHWLLEGEEGRGGEGSQAGECASRQASVQAGRQAGTQVSRQASKQGGRQERRQDARRREGGQLVRRVCIKTVGWPAKKSWQPKIFQKGPHGSLLACLLALRFQMS